MSFRLCFLKEAFVIRIELLQTRYFTARNGEVGAKNTFNDRDGVEKPGCNFFTFYFNSLHDFNINLNANCRLCNLLAG